MWLPETPRRDAQHEPENIHYTRVFALLSRFCHGVKPITLEKLVDATRSFQVRDSISIKDRWRACGSAADFVIESISKGAL